MEIEEVINNLGYLRLKCLWYHYPKYSFEHGRKPLNNDKDVLKFWEDMFGYESVNIYVENVVDELDVITKGELRDYVEPIQ